MIVWLLYDCYCLLKIVFFLYDVFIDLLILLLIELKFLKMFFNYFIFNDNNFGMFDKIDSEIFWYINLEI